jgi:hypothetical protein
MPAENIYDLYITDADRNIIREEKSVAADTDEKIIREYPWLKELQSYVQLWKQHTRFSFSVHYMHAIKKFCVGFSDKVSLLKLPLPYVGVNYGLFDEMDDVIASLVLFLAGEFEKLKNYLEQYRPVQKGD